MASRSQALKGNMFADDRANDDCDTESLLLLLEKEPKPRQPGFSKYGLPWIFHGTSILICIALLLCALDKYSRSRMGCLERFNAYCKLNPPLTKSRTSSPSSSSFARSHQRRLPNHAVQLFPMAPISVQRPPDASGRK